jgi:transposase
MLNLPPSVRIWLCAQPVDLRKSFDSLAEVVRARLGGDPLSGHLFVFRNKSGDRLKLLYWDEDGYVILYKRLEVGVFHWPLVKPDAASVTLRAADLLMLLDGVDLKTVRRGRRYRRSPATTVA